jgi:hypothetical protein
MTKLASLYQNFSATEKVVAHLLLVYLLAMGIWAGKCVSDHLDALEKDASIYAKSE